MRSTGGTEANRISHAKRVGTAIALAFALAMLAAPQAAHAVTPASGVVSAGVTWTLDANGLLSITGSGSPNTTSKWSANANDITGISIAPTVTPVSLAGWFSSCTALQSVDASSWNLSRCKSLSKTFSGCSALTSVNASGWDTSSVTNMSSMFANCPSLQSVNMQGWTTSAVKNTSYMFSGCTDLSSLDIGSWDMSANTTTVCMFTNCSNLAEIPVSAWNMSANTTIGLMFSGCTSVRSLDLSGWSTSNVTNMGNAFSKCTSLESLNLHGWDTTSVTNFGNTFDRDAALTSLDIGGWTTAAFSTSEETFRGCASLQSLDLSGWNCTAAQNMANMFIGCSSLRRVDLGPNWTFTGAIADSSRYAALPDPPSTGGFTGLWQAVGTGSVASPAGGAATAAALQTSYAGATMADTFVWQPLQPISGTLSISGDPMVASTLTATVANAPADAQLACTWYRAAGAGQDGIAVGEGFTRTLVEDDYGTYLYAVVVDSGGTYVEQLRSTSLLIGAQISVTVPLQLHFSASSDGRLTCPTDAAVQNDSTIGMHVSGLTATALGNTVIYPLASTGGTPDAIGIRMQPGSGTPIELSTCLGGAAVSGSAWGMSARDDASTADRIPLSFEGRICAFGTLNPAIDTHFAGLTWTVSTGRTS